MLESSSGPTLTVRRWTEQEEEACCSEFSRCWCTAGIKQPKHNWEEQSSFQPNLLKNLLCDWAEAERKSADEPLFLYVPKEMTMQKQGEFLLFLLICA